MYLISTDNLKGQASARLKYSAEICHGGGWEEHRSTQRLSRRRAVVSASGGCQESVNCIKAKDKHITASLVTARSIMNS